MAASTLRYESRSYFIRIDLHYTLLNIKQSHKSNIGFFQELIGYCFCDIHK